jgi:glycosyltransferase involved in cell wall biosynthesis
LPENLTIGHFHLGADIERSFPTSGFPEDAERTLAAIKESIGFVIVGTIEPRKGHLQVIKAFEYLWDKNCNIKLVIIGKNGWMADDIVDRIRAHPELNNRLIWLEGISDEYLEKVYAASTCLIAASYGEGFGLPLIEAAQHKLPIIARDIPVFREVAGEHAFYFSATSPDGLAGAIEEWLGLHANDKHPKSDTMPWLTWAQSSSDLLAQIGLSRLGMTSSCFRVESA